jgi:hypothetical protein
MDVPGDAAGAPAGAVVWAMTVNGDKARPELSAITKIFFIM